ncbi:hypothetical protein MMC30_006339 [Trapelia coarctata]|nr:hypothetical protein [Trapelia coarctata]
MGNQLSKLIHQLDGGNPHKARLEELYELVTEEQKKFFYNLGENGECAPDAKELAVVEHAGRRAGCFTNSKKAKETTKERTKTDDQVINDILGEYVMMNQIGVERPAFHLFNKMVEKGETEPRTKHMLAFVYDEQGNEHVGRLDFMLYYKKLSEDTNHPCTDIVAYAWSVGLIDVNRVTDAYIEKLFDEQSACEEEFYGKNFESWKSGALKAIMEDVRDKRGNAR